jgi:hypothetical protein
MISPISDVTPEEAAAEFRRLHAQLVAVVATANAALQSAAMSSAPFSDAHEEVGRLRQRLREIQGLAEKRWFA